MWKADSFEKTLMLGKIEGRRRRDNRGWDGWMASPTQWTWVWINSGSWWWTGRPGMLQFMESQSCTRLSDWIELNWFTMKQWDWKPWSYFSECWVLNQIFHSSFTFIKGLFSCLLEQVHSWSSLRKSRQMGFCLIVGLFFVCLFVCFEIRMGFINFIIELFMLQFYLIWGDWQSPSHIKSVFQEFVIKLNIQKTKTMASSLITSW